MFQVQLTKQAEKAFDHLMKSQPHLGQRVARAIDRLAKYPDLGIPLKGDLKGYHKYRVGPYRILYQIFRSKLLIIVIDIGHRKEIYR